MTTHDFGTTLPLGICSTCLARMVDPKVGMPARTLALPDGRTIFAVYCEPNVAGAWRGRAGLWKSYIRHREWALGTRGHAIPKGAKPR